MDVFGRLKSLFVSFVIIFIGGLVSVFVFNSMIVFIIFCGIVGFGIGKNFKK